MALKIYLFCAKAGQHAKMSVHSRVPFHKVCSDALEMELYGSSALYTFLLVAIARAVFKKLPVIVWEEHYSRQLNHLNTPYY